MKLRRRAVTPPIFADLAIEVNGSYTIVDVEEPGWLSRYGGALECAGRVGLQLRKDKSPRVWLVVNDGAPEYRSRIIGQVEEDRHERTRVAGLTSGGVSVWLHKDGLVEVGPEPTFRMV